MSEFAIFREIVQSVRGELSDPLDEVENGWVNACDEILARLDVFTDEAQPFGFTWEMVRAIRSCAEIMRSEWGFKYDGVHPEAAQADIAADRIAALLPPEGP